MKKIFNLCNIVNIISLVINTYLLSLIIKINIIPARYLMILVGVIYVLNIILIILTTRKSKIIKTMGYIILITYILISSVATFYLKSTDNFLDNSFDNATNYKYTTYYVLNNSQASYNTFNDINNNNLYYYSYEYNAKQILDELSKEAEFSTTPYDDITLMFSNLKNGIISFALVEKSKYDSIIELDSNLNSNDFKILYEYKLKEEMNVESSSNNDSFNIYIGGNDFTNNNIDFNMIVSINTKTHKVLLTSIPRDYYIEVYGYNGKKDNLSFIGNLGIDTSMKSIESLFGIKIDYYLKINTNSLVKLVDAVGGINYCSDQEYTTTHAMILGSYNDSIGKKLYVKKGCQHLNGIETLTVARERKKVGNDRQRQKNCQAILIDIVEQLQSTNTILNYNKILNSITSFYETTLPKEVITDIIKETVNEKSNWSFETISVDGDDTKGYVHLSNMISSVMIPNMGTVNEAKNKIISIIGGDMQ